MSDADYEEILRLVDEQSIDIFLDKLDNSPEEYDDGPFKFEYAHESLTEKLTVFKMYLSD